VFFVSISCNSWTRYFHSVFVPEDPSGGAGFQFWDGGDDDCHGLDVGFEAGARAFVVATHAEAGIAFDLSHGEDWIEPMGKGRLSPGVWTVLVSTGAGCETPGLLG
jgi:hypothetical protein